MSPDTAAADTIAIAGTLDPVALALATGVVLDPWQARVVRSPARYQLLNVHRQGGKSLCAALLSLYQALRTRASLTVIAAPTLRQASESIRKVRALLAALRLPDVAQDTALA